MEGEQLKATVESAFAVTSSSQGQDKSRLQGEVANIQQLATKERQSSKFSQATKLPPLGNGQRQLLSCSLGLLLLQLSLIVAIDCAPLATDEAQEVAARLIARKLEASPPDFGWPQGQLARLVQGPVRAESLATIEADDFNEGLSETKSDTQIEAADEGQQQLTDSINLLLLLETRNQRRFGQQRARQESDENKGFKRSRLFKRSGISDQRLAEIQMIRALKKQLERASKLAASNQPNPPEQQQPISDETK